MADEKQQLTEARKQLAKLEREISECHVRRRVTEGRLDAEHKSLRMLASQRDLNVAGLADASAETAAKIHATLDKLESEIRAAERRAQSLRTLLRGLDESLTGLGSERDRIGQTIAAEENAKAFAAGRARIEQQFAALHETLAAARGMMAELNVDAAKFGERFSGAGYNIVAPLFDTFLTTEHNLEQNGFKPVFGYRQDFRVVLNPMVPR